MNNVLVIAMCQVLEAVHKGLLRQGGFTTDRDWNVFWNVADGCDCLLRNFGWFLWVESDRTGWAVPIDTTADNRPVGIVKFMVRRWPYREQNREQSDFRQGATSQTEGALFSTDSRKGKPSNSQKNDR